MTVDLAELCRDLHQHPELSLQEFRTAGVLADALRSLGFEVTTGVGGTGVVGVQALVVAARAWFSPE